MNKFILLSFSHYRYAAYASNCLEANWILIKQLLFDLQP